MKKIDDESHENHERWLLTYSDLITLLMIFFVIMYAMSNVNEQKYSELSKSLSVSMGGGKSIIGNDSNKSINEIPLQEGIPEEQRKFNNLKNNIDEYLKENGLTDNIITQIDERGLVIRFKDSILFDSGKADVRPEYREDIIKIGRILGEIQSFIRVEGHTDNVPMKSREFKSNWQLSAIRATNVTELLINESGISPIFNTSIM